MSQTRQLAAILFTDIAGYTAMMQRDEETAVKMVKHHRAVLEKTVDEFEGNVIEFYGDGSLCIFTSITEAMHCALRIQQEMQAEPPVPLRIGLHIGEVIYEDGKIMGDGVNIASRIQSLGLAGSILFSKEIFDKIRNHPEFKTVYLGRFHLKNVADPMEVFALANEGITVPAGERIEGRVDDTVPKKSFKTHLKWALPLFAALILWAFFMPGLFKKKNIFSGPEKSIAVLPFNNISNDTLQQYFSDGITEDIITQLSKIADLKVISRTSVMQYKDNRKNIKEIAKELGVATILEGSVRKEGNKLRIIAQLIDAQTDKHLWSETYDRDASEVFAIQSEVAQNIANALNVKLTTEEGKRIIEKATDNVEAYELYLRAKRLPFSQRVDTLLEALQKDSAFSLAWAELASAYSKIPWRNQSEKPYYVRKSLDAALTAVAYGPERSVTHMMLGDVLKISTLSPALAIKELNRAIELNPNNAEAYVYKAFAQMEMANFAEAEKNLSKAKQLDPLSPIMHGGWLTYYRYSRNPGKYLSYRNQMRPTNNPDSIPGTKMMYHFLKDEYDSVLFYSRNSPQFILQSVAYTRTGQNDKAKKHADSLESVSPYDHAFQTGVIYAWLGEKQKAIEKLNLAYRLYDFGLISIKVDKLFDPLRNEE
ncbi:MAG TPA: adenylate/guanylate cyclase domain-containing protein, partial [Chitinophagaceae bacterium]|nr:adenylate/guanylate cyclase domain-containing protein [Chitinophagaceae bacterium]